MSTLYELRLVANFLLNDEQLLDYQNLIDEERYYDARMYLAGALEEYVLGSFIEQSIALWFYSMIDIPISVVLKIRAKQNKGGAS